jgi:hypothetical protein
MQARTLVFALTLASLWAGATAAQQLPRFNIETTCRTAQALTAEDRDPVQGCMRDEAEAERQLQTVWTSAAAAHREACEAETRVEGFPSYVDVLTCLQMYQGVAPSAPPRRRKQP